MPADVERVRSALASIDSGDRETWVRMAFAIYAEYGDGGFDLWDAWSRTWPGYIERDARKTWSSAARGSASGRSGRGVTVASLFHLAKERGWRWDDDGPDRTQAVGGQRRNGDGRGSSPPDSKQGAQRGSSSRRREATAAEKRAYAASVWRAAGEVPQDDESPARRWLAARNLWWPGLPLPAAVRFIERVPTDGWPYPGGPPRAAAVVALIAPPDAWIAAWPELPEPTAVQCVFINCDGSKAFPHGPDEGDKRTYAPPAGGVVLLGEPSPTPDGELVVCEGLADGIGLAARGDVFDTVAAAITTPSTGGPLEDYAAAWGSVAVYGDDDDAGTRKAWRFVAALRARDVAADRKRFAGYNDPAEAFEAGAEPLADVRSRRDDVRDLADAWEGLPRWEALRRAALCIVDDHGPADEDDGAAPSQGQLMGMGTQGH